MQTTDDQKELFIVVDESDTVLGYKTRGECHKDRNIIHRAVGVILYNSKGEIAFQKRSMTKDTSPGYYAISSSGHVSKGETYEQAAIREMEEEIGVKGVKIDLVKTHLMVCSFEKEMDTLYVGKYDGQFNINKDEVEGMYYFNKDQVASIQNKMTPCSVASLKIIGWL